MKYIKFISSLFLVGVLISGLISAAQKPYVTVIHVSGKAEYLSSGSATWKPVKKGIVLYSGDGIKTYKNASVEIAFDDRKKNVISVEPDTHVVIKLEGYEKIELIDGEVFLLVKKLARGSSFEIRTPTAVCGARGTGSATRANKDRTVVSAHENNSYAKGINKDGTVMKDEVVVPEGFETVIKRFERPSKLMKISQKDAEKWNRWRDDFIERVSARRTMRERLSKDLDKIAEKKARIEERQDADRIEKRDRREGAGSGSRGQMSAGQRE